jgi:hypothetical protein
MSEEGDIRELQVEVNYLKRDRDVLMDFKEQIGGLIVEYEAHEQRRETRGARLLRSVTITGGVIGILSAVGVIFSQSL